MNRERLRLHRGSVCVFERDGLVVVGLLSYLHYIEAKALCKATITVFGDEFKTLILMKLS